MAPRNGDYKLSVEKRITRIETKVDDMMGNHLPHLQKGIDNNAAKIDRSTWLVMSTLTGLVSALIVLAIKLS